MYYLGHMGFFGGYGMILLWVVIIGFIIWLITQNKRKEDSSEIAKERYAKGEITKEEYYSLKKELK